jgi:hypothetical protein
MYVEKVQVNNLEWYTPCDAADASAESMTWEDVPLETLKEPQLMPVDFFATLSNMKHSVGQEEMEKYRTWTRIRGCLTVCIGKTDSELESDVQFGDECVWRTDT